MFDIILMLKLEICSVFSSLLRSPEEAVSSAELPVVMMVCFWILLNEYRATGLDLKVTS